MRCWTHEAEDHVVPLDRTIARMPARTGSGRLGQASITRCRSESRISIPSEVSWFTWGAGESWSWESPQVLPSSPVAEPEVDAEQRFAKPSYGVKPVPGVRIPPSPIQKPLILARNRGLPFIPDFIVRSP